MGLIGTAIVALIAQAGLLAGMGLGYIAKEELEDGRKYFLVLVGLLFGTIVLSAMSAFFHMILSVPAGVVSAAAVILLMRRLVMKRKKGDAFIRYGWAIFALYAAMGVMFGMTDPVLKEAVLASGVFVLGLPLGSLMVADIKRMDTGRMVRAVLMTLPFIMIGLTLKIIMG